MGFKEDLTRPAWMTELEFDEITSNAEKTASDVANTMIKVFNDRMNKNATTDIWDVARELIYAVSYTLVYFQVEEQTSLEVEVEEELSEAMPDESN